MPKAVTFIISTMLCSISAAWADEATISCAYSGIYHHTVFNNPALNKNDEAFSGAFFLTFDNTNGNSIKGYYWGIRPDNNLTRSYPEEGPLLLFAITDDKITIRKYFIPYSYADEYIDRKTGHYEFADTYGDGSRRNKSSGDCEKTSLRAIPKNKF